MFQIQNMCFFWNAGEQLSVISSSVDWFGQGYFVLSSLSVSNNLDFGMLNFVPFVCTSVRPSVLCYNSCFSCYKRVDEEAEEWPDQHMGAAHPHQPHRAGPSAEWALQDIQVSKVDYYRIYCIVLEYRPRIKLHIWLLEYKMNMWTTTPGTGQHWIIQVSGAVMVFIVS